MLMKRGALALGLVMLLIGCYFFIVSMIMIMTDSIIDNWMTWTLYLTIGILLISFGPGVMVWAYTQSHLASFQETHQNSWMIIQIPQRCPRCENELEAYNLEWIGPSEARCPYCSNEIEVRISKY